MSKAILMSIQPKWCELIASGKKTVEVRKTRPKIDVPFKCYIYETKGKLRWCNNCQEADCERPYPNCACWEGQGKVIGEFVCDEITEYEGEFYDDETQETIKKVIHTTDWDGYPEIDYNFIAENGEENSLCKFSCVSWEELRNYMGAGINTFYAWHISDLVIYDKPIELGETGEFYTWKKCNSCRDTGYESTACCFDIDCKVPAVISKPPQSWCYVEQRSNR